MMSKKSLFAIAPSQNEGRAPTLLHYDYHDEVQKSLTNSLTAVHGFDNPISRQPSIAVRGDEYRSRGSIIEKGLLSLDNDQNSFVNVRRVSTTNFDHLISEPKPDRRFSLKLSGSEAASIREILKRVEMEETYSSEEAAATAHISSENFVVTGTSLGIILMSVSIFCIVISTLTGAILMHPIISIIIFINGVCFTFMKRLAHFNDS